MTYLRCAQTDYILRKYKHYFNNTMKKQKPLVRVTVRLSSKELEFVKKTAKKDKVSLSQAVRDLIAYGMY